MAVPSKVGEAGVGAELESVVQRPVHADVGQPDQGEGQNERLMLSNTDPSERRRQRCGVHQVVEVCTDARAPEVAPGQSRQAVAGGPGRATTPSLSWRNRPGPR